MLHDRFDGTGTDDPTSWLCLQRELLERFDMEVPVFFWPKPPHRLLRISAQAYDHTAQYERLAEKMAVRLDPR